MPIDAVVADALRDSPDLLLIGHSGSTSAHPTALDIATRVKAKVPATLSSMAGYSRPITGATSSPQTAVFDINRARRRRGDDPNRCRGAGPGAHRSRPYL